MLSFSQDSLLIPSESVSNPVVTSPLPVVKSSSKATHTVTLPVETVSHSTSGPRFPVPVASSATFQAVPAGVRSDQFFRSRWPSTEMPPPPPPPMPFGLYHSYPSWPMPTVASSSTPSDPDVSQQLKGLQTSIHKLTASMNAKFLEFGGRLRLLEAGGPGSQTLTSTSSNVVDQVDNGGQGPHSLPSESLGSQGSQPPLSSSSSAENSKGQASAEPLVVPASNEDDTISLAPRSNEHAFLDTEEIPQLEEGEIDDNSSESVPNLSGMVNLRSRVYAIRREVSENSMPSPPRTATSSSDFMSCAGMVKSDIPKYESFPESSHFRKALDYVNDTLEKGASGLDKKLPFGPASFATAITTKRYNIHGDTFGKKPPVVEKQYSSLLGVKVPSNATLPEVNHTKLENNLRIISNALQTAEHFLVAVGTILKDQGEEFDEIKAFLCQIDRCLGDSQQLTLGSIANLTLAKRQQILEKFTTSDVLKDKLIFSRLDSDKLFSLPIEKVQEELNKVPPTVKVDVNVSNGQRKVSSVPVVSQSNPRNSNSNSSQSGQSGKRRVSFNSRGGGSSGSGKKLKLAKGKSSQK